MRRRRSKRAPRPTCVYEFHYQFFAYEYTEVHYRLRCPQLTKVQINGSAALIGEVSFKHGGKWTEFAPGALPAIFESMARFVVQIVEKPQMSVVKS